MSDITYYSWLILANIWLAASFGVNDSFSRMLCNLIGVLWLLLAIFGKLAG